MAAAVMLAWLILAGPTYGALIRDGQATATDGPGPAEATNLVFERLGETSARGLDAAVVLEATGAPITAPVNDPERSAELQPFALAPPVPGQSLRNAARTDTNQFPPIQRTAQRTLQGYLSGVDPMAMATARFAGAAASFPPVAPDALRSCGVLTECRTISVSEPGVRPATTTLSPEFTPGFFARLSGGGRDADGTPAPGAGSARGSPTDLVPQEENPFLPDLMKRVLVYLGILQVSGDVPKVALVVVLVLCVVVGLAVERTSARRKGGGTTIPSKPAPVRRIGRKSRRSSRRRSAAGF